MGGPDEPGQSVMGRFNDEDRWVILEAVGITVGRQRSPPRA